MIDSTIGLDPGLTTGMAFLDYENGKLVGKTILQCDGGSAPYVLKGLLTAYYTEFPGGAHTGKRIASVEKFVTGQSAGTRGKPADVTRQLVMELAEVCEMFGYLVKIRSAADVKPWASDKRIAKALGMKEEQLTGSLRHGWDGIRHCIYGAWEAGVVQDPLLRRKPALCLFRCW